MVTDPQTNKPTNTQGRLQYTVPLSVEHSVKKYMRKLIDFMQYLLLIVELLLLVVILTNHFSGATPSQIWHTRV